jgi:hypothetical protein
VQFYPGGFLLIRFFAILAIFCGYSILRLFFALFVPVADVAKGGDGAKSAFLGFLFSP